MSRPLMLDAFSGAGGCGAGYHRAGFTVIGVDLKDQPNYPYEFHQGDALETLDDLLAGKSWHGYRLRDFAAIHGSPPCQAYSSIAKQQRVRSPGKYDAKHLDLVDDTRQRFRATGLPYVIENVIGAPLENPIMLCGSSFGLNVRRHRLFECHGFAVMAPPCAHHWQTPRFRSLDKRRGDKSVVPVHGGGRSPDLLLGSRRLSVFMGTTTTRASVNCGSGRWTWTG